MDEPQFICKVIVLVLCVISVGLVVDPFNHGMGSKLNHIATIYVTLCGYIIIIATLIIGTLLGEKPQKKTSLIFTVVGALLCLTSGILLICDWDKIRENTFTQSQDDYANQMIAAGIITLLAAIALGIDSVFTGISSG